MTRLRYLPTILALLYGTATLSAQTWVPYGPPGGDVSLITEDPVTGTLYLYGEDQGIYRNGVDQGLYRLTPGDAEWEPVPTSDLGTFGTKVRIAAYDDHLVALRGCCEVLFSHDGGTTWREWYNHDPATWTFGDIVLVDSTFYVPVSKATGGSAQLYRCSSGSESWGPSDMLGVGAVLFTDGSRLYVSSSLGVQRRISDGLWKSVRSDKVEWLLADSNVVVIGGAGRSMERSFDFGKTWSTIPAPYGMPLPPDDRFKPFIPALRDDTLWTVRAEDVAMMPVGDSVWSAWRPWGPYRGSGKLPRLLVSDGMMLIYGYQGTFRWDAGDDRFRPFDDGQHGLDVAHILTIGDTLLAAVNKGSYDILYVTGDDGASWELRPMPNDRIRGDMILHEGIIYECADHALNVSPDLGRTWSSRRTGIGSDSVWPSTLHARGDRIFVGGNGILRATIGSDEWERLPTPPDAFVAMIVGAPRDTLFARAQPEGGRRSLIRSTDDGDTWETLDSLLPRSRWSGVLMVSIGQIAYANGVLYFGTGEDGLYRSFDGGESWTGTLLFDPTNPPPDTTSVWVNPIHTFDDTVIVQVGHPEFDSIIVYISVDRGDTWTTIATPPVIAHQIHPFGDRLLAATVLVGIQSLRFTTGVDERPMRAAAIGIAHDPAHRLLRWSTPSPTSYAIEIHSLSGRHLMTAASGDVEAGEHVAALPELAPGLYLCTIRTPHGDAGILMRVE